MAVVKLYDYDMFGEFIDKSNDYVAFGCPLNLNINNLAIDYIIDKFIWQAPFNTLVMSHDKKFAYQLYHQLLSILDEMGLGFQCNEDDYMIIDSNSALKINIVSEAKKIVAGEKFFDLCIMHFCDDMDEKIVEKILMLSKKVVFLTLDKKDSTYYKLDNDKNFFRLRSDETDDIIENYISSGYYDDDKYRLIAGKFNKDYGKI